MGNNRDTKLLGLILFYSLSMDGVVFFHVVCCVMEKQGWIDFAEIAALLLIHYNFKNLLRYSGNGGTSPFLEILSLVWGVAGFAIASNVALKVMNIYCSVVSPQEMMKRGLVGFYESLMRLDLLLMCDILRYLVASLLICCICHCSFVVARDYGLIK